MNVDTHTDGHNMLFLFSEALSRLLRVLRPLFRHYSRSETHEVTQDAITDAWDSLPVWVGRVQFRCDGTR